MRLPCPLSPPLPERVGHAAHLWGGPTLVGRGPRSHHGPPYLGTKSGSASPCPLSRDRRRFGPGGGPVDSDAASTVPLPSQSPRAGLSREVSRRAPPRVHPATVDLCGGDGAADGARQVWAVVGHPVAPGLGRLCETTLCWPAAGGRVSRALYASDRAQQ